MIGAATMVAVTQMLPVIVHAQVWLRQTIQCLAVEENFINIPAKPAATNAQPLARRTLTPEVQGSNPVHRSVSLL